MISVVFPAYNEEDSVVELHRRLVAELEALSEPYEIIAVNNASTDRTRELLLSLSPITIISIAYNIGQTAALDAGIHAARGDVIVTLDADLQNDPQDIGRMFAKLQEGYDAVVGWRQERNDPLSRKVFSKSANWLTRTVLKLPINDYACALKMFKKEYIEGIRLYGEMHVFLAAILFYRGARITELPVIHHERARGLSKHTFIKGLKDLADLFTVKFLFSTSRPLLIFGGFGIASWIVSASAAFLALILKITDLRDFAQTPLPEFTSLFMVLGFLFIMGGFLGELIIRAYYEGAQQRPYKVKEIIKREKNS